MYHDHFGFHTDPFPLSPSLKFLYRSRAFEETMAHIVYGLNQGEEIILITGAIGMGKTLALHNLLSLTESSYRQVFVNVTQVNYREILKLIVRDLGLDSSRATDRADLLLMLRDELRASSRRGEKVLLIVDEAQNLSLETLEGLRLLGNLTLPESPVLRIVLSGQIGLEEKLERPELAQIRQRIRVHYRLEPLTRPEVEQYVQHRLRVAGGSEGLFTRGALDHIHQLSGGVPRLVNHLASKGLLAAFVADARRVEASHIDPAGTPAPPDLVPAESPRLAPARTAERARPQQEGPRAQPRPQPQPQPQPPRRSPPPVASPPPAAPPPPAITQPPLPAPPPSVAPPLPPAPARPGPEPTARPPLPQPLPASPPRWEPAAHPAPAPAPEPAAAPRSAVAARPAPAASRDRLDELLPPPAWRRRSGGLTLLYVTLLVLAAFVLAVLLGPTLWEAVSGLGGAR